MTGEHVPEVVRDLLAQAEGVAHLVDPGPLAGDALVRSAVRGGLELRALCGFQWVPSGFGVDEPICSACAGVLAAGSVERAT